MTEDIIEKIHLGVKGYGACVVGMPVKDTIKIADESGLVEATPRRSESGVQTPQSFSYPCVYEAYTRLQACDKTGVTDDAMVVKRPSGACEGRSRAVTRISRYDPGRSAHGGMYFAVPKKGEEI